MEILSSKRFGINPEICIEQNEFAIAVKSSFADIVMLSSIAKSKHKMDMVIRFQDGVNEKFFVRPLVYAEMKRLSREETSELLAKFGLDPDGSYQAGDEPDAIPFKRAKRGAS